MSGVKIEPFNIQVNGGGNVSQFDLWTDFNVVQTIGDARLNYLHNISLASAAGNTYSISAVNNIDFVITGTSGVPGSNYATWNPTSLPGAKNVEQFSEALIIDNTTTFRGGLCVCISGDGNLMSTGSGNNNGYFLETVRDAGTMRIIRVVNNTAVILTTFAGPALGDKVSFTAQFIVGNTRLKVYYNEVLQTTFDDATAIKTGLPGFWSRESNAGTILRIRSLRCGKLTRIGFPL